jgi:hypothetical protein
VHKVSFSSENLKGRDHLRYLDLDRKIIQDDYKYYDRIHKFIGKEVTSIQVLNLHHYACVQIYSCLSCCSQLFEFNFCVAITFLSWGSSVSIVSGYGLDDRAIEVRSLTEAKGLFL